MMWALSLLGIARKALQAVFSLARAYPLQAALIASLCLAGWFWRGEQRWHREALSAQATIQQIKAAQVEALRNAMIAKAAQEQIYATKAKEADHAKDELQARVDVAASRYADTHRVRVASGCVTSGTSATAEVIIPEGADRSGEAADMVAVSRDDFDTMNENTARLVAAHDWALGLSSNP